MMPMPVPPPPSQQARLLLGPLSSPASPSIRRELRPMPPQPSRISQLPTVLDRWGHMSGLGADTDRMQTQSPAFSAESLLQPLGCAIAGFLLFGLLSK